MALDADQLVVAQDGSINVAPVGTALPDDPTTALGAGFVHLGYATQDGVTFNAELEIIDRMAWQSRRAIRRDIETQNITAAFQLQQWNKDTIPLAFGGGTVTEPDPVGSPGVFRYDFPTGADALDERAMVIDWQDGSKNYRLVIERGNVTEGVETNLQRADDAGLLPITFGLLDGDVYLVTDDPAFDPAP